MALIFQDPNSAGPFTTFQIKDVVTKVFKLTNTNFGTVAVNTLIGRLPAQASIVRITTWVKTQLAGGGITAATINLGLTSGGTDFVSGVSAFGTAGAYTVLSPVSGIFQPYQIPVTGDISLWLGGTATTGNPTSGEIYVMVEYVC